jgi:glyoxylase-like metal-dependent hydrolase (beta-lactamase superfamily II)
MHYTSRMAHQWSWTLLRAGSFRLDGGSMFGVVPKSIWSRIVEPDGFNRIPLQTNCLLLDDGSRKVLIETGFGGKWSDKERGFYELERRTIIDALREIDVEADQVDHVIVSHLHFDHAAGLTSLDASGHAIPRFPTAEIIVQRTEWDDALANKSTMTRTYLRSHLDPIADRVRLVDGESEALPGIHLWPMPGHTWGQQAIRFDDGDGTVAFVGDVMPTANHVGLAYSLAYDMLPHENMLSKRRLLEHAAGEGWRIALDHEPGDAVVRVVRDPDDQDRFKLEAAEQTSRQVQPGRGAGSG